MPILESCLKSYGVCLRGGCFFPFYVMNHFSGINATRLTFSKDFILGCLDLREASLVHYFELDFTCN
jgi:hypothetical protein